MTERVELPSAVRTLSTVDTERLRKKYPDLQMSLQDCPTCKGKRKYRSSLDRYEECNCEGQFKLHRFLLNAGIDLNYQRLSWTDCTAVQKEALAQVMEYEEYVDGYVNAGIGLLLYGDKGAGKTLLITLLMKMLLSKGFDAYFITFQELIDVYTQTWRDSEEKAWFEKRVRNAGILGIDDIGRENKGRIEIVESMFDHIIRARVGAARPTLITTNRSMEDFLSFYRSNVMSLLGESSIKIHVTGEDYRPRHKEAKLADARAGINRPIVLS